MKNAELILQLLFVCIVDKLLISEPKKNWKKCFLFFSEIVDDFIN